MPIDVSDYAYNINGSVIDFVKFGDAKAGSLFALTGLVSGGLFVRIEAFATQAMSVHVAVAVVGAMLAIISLGASACAGWWCLLALAPKSESATSLNSFPDIARHPLETYLDAIKSIQAAPDAIASNYSAHNWMLAKIALNKFAAISSAVTAVKVQFVTGSVFIGLELAIRTVKIFGESA